MEAKVISKVFKFIAAAGIILCAVLKWLGVIPNATAGEGTDNGANGDNGNVYDADYHVEDDK